MFGRKLRKLLIDQAHETKHRLDHIDHEIKALKFQIISFSVQLNELKNLLMREPDLKEAEKNVRGSEHVLDQMRKLSQEHQTKTAKPPKKK